MNPKSPDFEHKVTNKVLWVDGCSTPLWVNAMLKLAAQSKLPFHVTSTGDFQGIVQPNRYWHEHAFLPL